MGAPKEWLPTPNLKMSYGGELALTRNGLLLPIVRGNGVRIPLIRKATLKKL